MLLGKVRGRPRGRDRVNSGVSWLNMAACNPQKFAMDLKHKSAFKP